MILLLTAGFGDGHNTAARNVASGLNRVAPHEETQIVDLSEVAHPLVSPLLKTGYQMLITHAPKIWGNAFTRTAKMDLPDSAGAGVFAGLHRALRSLLLRDRPQAIVSTYPIYSKIIQTLRAEGLAVPPLFTVVTDSIRHLRQAILRIWLQSRKFVK